MRHEIFNDPRFNELWWLENDWAYNGMFQGQEPRDFLLEIKEHGALGYYIWEVVQQVYDFRVNSLLKSWAGMYEAYREKMRELYGTH